MMHRARRLLIIAAALAAAPATADDGHGSHGMAHAAHMKMTGPRTATAEDAVRYHAIEDAIRRNLARYRDVAVATADGFEPFLPGVEQREYHYTKRANAFAAAFTFDPSKPTSLLYRREPDGRYTLTGVMYTAPAFFDEADLDERVPLSMAPWHQHVNLCVPGAAHRERWAETRDGEPVFGSKSAITTEAACEAVGGKFVPRLFGWMVHVEAFEGA